MSETSTQSDKQARKVVLLDDESSVVFALRLLLETLGYSVADFVSPHDAIKYLEDGNNCDLFLCDLRMPEMNGIQVLQACAKMRPEIAFVLMSAHANSEEIATAKALGARGFIAKPFEPEELQKFLGGE
ncbi:MAG: hypothetical protein DCC75_12860 [Proteobacteria bacterium]|nr:MAG: hypothetical protein DCC75_12860 [Pseudomonadota bacterium]